jgi:hypothetical protein
VILASAGLGLGLAGAYFVERAMQGTVSGIGRFDRSAIAAVGLILLATALLACYLPAHRAAFTEPMTSCAVSDGGVVQVTLTQWTQVLSGKAQLVFRATGRESRFWLAHRRGFRREANLLSFRAGHVYRAHAAGRSGQRL